MAGLGAANGLAMESGAITTEPYGFTSAVLWISGRQVLRQAKAGNCHCRENSKTDASTIRGSFDQPFGARHAIASIPNYRSLARTDQRSAAGLSLRDRYSVGGEFAFPNTIGTRFRADQLAL